MLIKNHKTTVMFLIFALGLFSACGSKTEVSNANKSNAEENRVNSAKAEKPKASNSNAEAEKKDELVEIYDGRDDFEPKDFPESEIKPVQAEFDQQIELIKDKMGDKFCNEVEAVSINGIAKGSFTKPKSNQKAVLYDVCRWGTSNFGVGGLIIFEGGKAVSHYVYGEHGLQSGLISSPDVNKNGLNELGLIDYQMHQGNSGTAILFAEIKDGELKFLGDVVTSSSNSGAVEDDKDTLSEAKVISVQPSANPTFFKDSYEIKGNGKDWKLVKKGEKFSLGKEENYAEDFKSLEITQVD